MRLASFGLTVDRPFARSSNVPTRHRPANPRLGVRVWPGSDKHNPYPYPAVPRGYGYAGTATRDNPYKPLKALNVDGTENKRGTIQQYVDLKFAINRKPQTQRLLLTGLGKQKIILGFPCLHKQNPQINWKTGEFKWPTYIPNIKRIRQLTEERERKLLDKSKKEQEPMEITEIKAKYQGAFIEEVQDEEEPMNHTQYPLDDNEPSILISLLDSLEPEEIWINARTNVATELAAEENKKKEGISP